MISFISGNLLKEKPCKFMKNLLKITFLHLQFLTITFVSSATQYTQTY